MGWRFRKSFKVLPGVRLNVGKRGVSASAGVKGASVSVSDRGARATVGIPGSGLSWSTGESGSEAHPRPRARGNGCLLAIGPLLSLVGLVGVIGGLVAGSVEGLAIGVLFVGVITTAGAALLRARDGGEAG